MPIVDLLIISLATWRIAHAITQESGPLALFDRIRSKFPPALDYDDEERCKDGSICELLSCPACMSIWTALICLLAWQVEPLRYIVCVFGLSGAALMLASFTGILYR